MFWDGLREGNHLKLNFHSVTCELALQGTHDACVADDDVHLWMLLPQLGAETLDIIYRCKVKFHA